MDERRTDEMSDSAGASRALLEGLARRPEVRGAILVDRAGRVLEELGIGARERVVQVATLVAALHATGARLSESVGDPGRSDLRIAAGPVTLLLRPLPAPSTLLLLVVTEGDPGGLEGVLEEVARRVEEDVEAGPVVADARDFEASLVRRMRRRDRQNQDGVREP